jgi:hypothetical protein
MKRTVASCIARIVLLAGPLLLLSGAAASPGAAGKSGAAADRLVVHEWGTFTVLQDEQGKAVGGINTDDEPVPGFVHNVSWDVNGPSSPLPPVIFKGVARNHPDVYTRLETPVIYFYPPGGREMMVDVEVGFPGGWLTQYYPDASVTADGHSGQSFKLGPLTYKSSGTLSWKGLKIGGSRVGPRTDVPAWLAPRQVPAAASVTTPKGEAERYLFYRGVGRMDAPLRVARSADGTELSVHSQMGNAIQLAPGMKMGPLWLVDARADGTSAYRTIDSVDVTQGPEKVVATTPAGFLESEYRRENLASLRKALHAALKRDGLFDDEAEGLLNTWETSYFKRPGLRLFFMVPRAWTDHHLPLHISAPADVQRAMVGRIELVTPGHRKLLKQISAGPTSEPSWVLNAREQLDPQEQDKYYREDWYLHAQANPSSARLLRTMPADYRAYLQLGRFRNALLLDQAKRQPTPALATFIKRYDLAAHEFDRTEQTSAR